MCLGKRADPVLERCLIEPAEVLKRVKVYRCASITPGSGHTKKECGEQGEMSLKASPDSVKLKKCFLPQNRFSIRYMVKYNAMMSAVRLKPGKEKPLLQKHRWVFSGAVASWPDEFSEGAMYPIVSSEGSFLGQGYFKSEGSIAGRVLSFDDRPLEQIFREALLSAKVVRESWLGSENTNAYRLIHGEADGLPGLVVDRYADTLVIQVTTLGMEKLRELWLPILVEVFQPKSVYEKSVLASRRLEGLADTQGWVWQSSSEKIEVRENGIRLLVDLADSQKTGFFLDQREMRRLVQEKAQGRRVLNCFSYSGGFSLAALAGGAVQADSVDISSSALELAKANAELNAFSDRHSAIEADVFEFLRQYQLPYDLIILDPPAFAKKRQDVPAAMRGYRDINRLAIEKAQPGSWLLTCSCSAHVDEALFQKIIFQASLKAKRSVRILQKHRQGADHPTSVFHPESEYLKSLWLYIE